MNVCAASAVLDLIPVCLFAEYADLTILCQCSDLRGICGCCLTDTKAVRLNNSGDTAHIAVMCFCLFPKYQIFILYVAFYTIGRDLAPLVSFFCYSNRIARHQNSDDLGICVCLAADVDISFYVCCSHCAPVCFI